ncbi:MAG: hypothetical protein BWZ10_01467 [candidate division BRC1 bacterium ADurb.BinA364]|nr:MAG: hypothetical protein BWZ10_01467 [candidate division BRC1 bacterium ADurb.BinA364]
MLRELRPDVVITNHGLQQDHGQHQACGAAIRQAFDACADPSFDPQGPPPFAVSKLYMRAPADAGDSYRSLARVEVPVGETDLKRGATYGEIALAALRRHRSQGLWPIQDWRPRESHSYLLMRSRLPNNESGIEADMGDGLDAYSSAPSAAYLRAAALQDADPTESALAAWAVEDEGARVEKLSRLLALANHLEASAACSDNTLVPGQTATLKVQIANRGQRPFFATLLEVQSEWIPDLQCEPAGLGLVRPGERATASMRLRIPNPPGLAGDPATRPESIYWYRKSRTTPLLRVEIAGNFGGAPSREGRFRLPAVEFDPELRRAVELVADPAEAPLVLARGESEPFSIVARNNAETAIEAARLRWTDPFSGAAIEAPLARIEANGGEARVDGIRFRAPENALPGVQAIAAEFAFGAAAPAGIDLPEPLELRLHALDVKIEPDRLVGLVETYDDTHAKAMRMLGIRFERIDEAMLRQGDLSRYDTILLDLRAYFARPDAVECNERLLDFARQGGHLVATYNKSGEWNREDGGYFSPYPLRLGRARVTREDAPMRILLPAHPHFTSPNRVAENDFDGWAQERSLYLPESWDERYEEAIECHDPNEPEQTGGHLTARVGAGTYTYTCFVWYRQLRIFNPGACKVFANMLAGGRAGSP